MLVTLTVILVALIFTYTNGFHDTANAIATVVGTKVLTPRQAIMMAAVTNLIGAFFGTAVAKTISGGLVEGSVITAGVLICALIAATFWNLLTWYYGLPSSSSHGLIGGLCGSALARVDGDWAVMKWESISEKIDPATGKVIIEKVGLLPKVIYPMINSPVAGLLIGFIVMTILYLALFNWRPRTVNRVFGKLQLLSSAGMGFSHGMSDATKCMGIITLALVTATSAGQFSELPNWLGFLQVSASADPKNQVIPHWVVVVCALTMAAGTAAGGWRIIKTMGHKMVKLQPVHGFAAETTGAAVLGVAAMMGMPVSTTHAITTSIMGVGCAKSLSSLKMKVVERIVWAWILTIPATGMIAYLSVKASVWVGWLDYASLPVK